jgi:hypothetical protein
MQDLVVAAGQQGGGLRRQERILSLAIDTSGVLGSPSPAGRRPPPQPPAAAEPEEQRDDPDQQKQGKENGIRGGGFAEGRRERFGWLGGVADGKCLGSNFCYKNTFLPYDLHSLSHTKGALKRAIKKGESFNCAA